jgi:hypothetical protein
MDKELVILNFLNLTFLILLRFFIKFPINGTRIPFLLQRSYRGKICLKEVKTEKKRISAREDLGLDFRLMERRKTA